MIIKHIPMRTLKRSDFASLIQYLTDKQGKFERVGISITTNCTAGNMDAVISEVLAVQQLNTRATGDKTYHLLVSFRPGENPEAEILKAIEDRICSSLGYGEHQRVSVVHHDTDNLHLHIAINKIHPIKFTLHEPYNAYRMFAKLSKALENDYGLEPDNHTPKKSLSECRADDMERHSGIESLMTWIRKECLPEIRLAQSWDALHRVLSENGLELQERGNGLVFKSSSGIMVKASTVARDISRNHLEKRLGPFEPYNQTARTEKIYSRRPVEMRIDADMLFKKYKKETEEYAATKALELGKTRTRKKNEIQAVQRSNRLRRATIKLMKGRIAKKLLYAKVHEDMRKKIQSINTGYQKERQGIHDRFQRLTWLDWLKKEALSGNSEALNALRSRMVAHGVKGNTISGIEQQPPFRHPLQTVVDTISKKGTVIIRTGKFTVRENGAKLKIANSNIHENIKEALQFAVSHYGNQITINGTDEFKNQVVKASVSLRIPLIFTDKSLEYRRQELIRKSKMQDKLRMHFRR
jgi:hypothetical protein